MKSFWCSPSSACTLAGQRRWEIKGNEESAEGRSRGMTEDVNASFGCGGLPPLIVHEQRIRLVGSNRYSGKRYERDSQRQWWWLRWVPVFTFNYAMRSSSEIEKIRERSSLEDFWNTSELVNSNPHSDDLRGFYFSWVTMGISTISAACNTFLLTILVTYRRFRQKHKVIRFA